MKKTTRRLAVLGAVSALAFAVIGPAFSTTSTVTLTDVSGSRTLTVTDVSGTTLDAATVSTGAGASIPFVTNVMDVLYDNLSYDVDASMSNLYLVDAASGTGFDCGVYVPAGDLAISWPTEAFGVDDVEALVTDVVFNISSTLSDSGDATLNTVLLDATGLVLGAGLGPADISRSGQGLVQSTLSDVALQSALSGEVLDELPLRISVGMAAPFSAAADHSSCVGGATSPTSINLQSGDPNAFDLTELAAEVEAAVGTLAGAVSGGHLTEDEVLGALFSDAALTEIQTKVTTLGLQAEWASYVDTTLVGAGSLNDVSIGTLVGQTGTYTSVPSLDVASDLNVTGTPPAGVANAYRGELVITLTSS